MKKKEIIQLIKKTSLSREAIRIIYDMIISNSEHEQEEHFILTSDKHFHQHTKREHFAERYY